MAKHSAKKKKSKTSRKKRLNRSERREPTSQVSEKTSQLDAEPLQREAPLTQDQSTLTHDERTRRSTDRGVFAYFQANRPICALVALRLSFFCLLAYDLWFVSLSHAPRYGAGSFNLAHIPLLDQLGWNPDPSIMGGLYLIGSVLSVLIAFGGGMRWAPTLLAGIYSLCYFGSQVDSYQHHYLISLFLILGAFYPWFRIKKEHRALDMIYIQIGIVYFWTALTKAEPIWLSGDILKGMITSASTVDTLQSVASTLSVSFDEFCQLSAWGIMVGEFFAAVEWIGLDIELFSYYMIALNICLLSPRKFWIPLEHLREIFRVFISTSMTSNRSSQTDVPSISERIEAPKPTSSTVPSVSWSRVYWVRFSVITWGAIVSILVLYWIMTLPVEGATVAGLISCPLVMLGITYPFNNKNVILLTHRGLCALFTVILIGSFSYTMRHSDFGYDYYRMWGGDLKRRGLLSEALDIYAKANELKAEGTGRHLVMGQLALKLNKVDVAQLAFEEGAQRWSVALKQAIKAIEIERNVKTKQALYRALKKVRKIYKESIKLAQRQGRSSDAKVSQNNLIYLEQLARDTELKARP